MSTMYETILSLPFFKGLNEDDISQFLEKIPAHFINFSDSDFIVEEGDRCEQLFFVISGKVRINVHHIDSDFKISSVLSSHIVLGADYLYGMGRNYPYNAQAVGKVSVLLVSKENFVRVMRSNEICGINYFNYISRRSQRLMDNIQLMGKHSYIRILAQWISQFTDTQSDEICIECSTELLSLLTGISEHNIEISEQKLKKGNYAYRRSEGLFIPSRSKFMSLLIP